MARRTHTAVEHKLDAALYCRGACVNSPMEIGHFQWLVWEIGVSLVA